MGKEIEIQEDKVFTVKDFLISVLQNSIPEDAQLNYKFPDGSIVDIKRMHLTDRDPEMGDIDLILEG